MFEMLKTEPVELALMKTVVTVVGRRERTPAELLEAQRYSDGEPVELFEDLVETEVVEIDARGYLRIKLPPLGEWQRAGNGVRYAHEIVFPKAVDDWGEVSHYGIFLGDHLLIQGQLHQVKHVMMEDTFGLAPGGLQVTLD
jgi:hypothetical protein